MRVVFPTNEEKGYLSKRGAHFGRAKFYTIITLENSQIENVEIVDNPGHQESGCLGAVENIIKFNPDALIVSGIGGNLARGFSQKGLDVYFDADSKTVNDSIDQFLLGNLNSIAGKETCSSY